MDKKLYDTWMTITSLVLGLMGMTFVLVSVFDEGATNLVLAVGLLFIALGNLLNVIRIKQDKKQQEQMNRR